ncbi:hypothetical protein [Sphingosinicella sp.]|uniref:hypothetical protein n=1 Tax=Sphingosinicella sp. TaxID=1917971 RepID=UPI0040380A93
MSDTMHALALIHRSGGNYIATGSTDTVPCPNPDCRHEMRVEDIIAGKHDYHTGAIAGILGILLTIAMVVGIVYLVRSCGS